MIFRDGSLFVFLAVLAFFIHALAPNKYVGYFVYLAFLLANLFAWRPLNVATNMVKFANRPAIIYSDFYRDAPFRTAWNWFTMYWYLFCALLAIAPAIVSRGGHLPFVSIGILLAAVLATGILASLAATAAALRAPLLAGLSSE